MGIRKKLAVYVPQLVLIATYALIRYLTFEPPLDWPIADLLYPLFALYYISPVLYEVLFWGSAAILSIVIGATPENHIHRFLLRPALTLASIAVVFGCFLGIHYSTIFLTQKIDIAHIESQVGEADEILYYNLNTHRYSTEGFTRPEITNSADCNHNHDMILIDYDRNTVSFLRELSKYDDFQLIPGSLPNHYQLIQIDVTLPNLGGRLITYYPDAESPHRTIAIQLILNDGSTYYIADLRESDTGYPYFLGLDAGMETKAKID